MNVGISKKARKQLLKIDVNYQYRIFTAIEKLPSGDVIKLVNNKNKYRLRVGYFRILFEMNGNNIEIYKIEKRGGVYQ